MNKKILFATLILSTLCGSSKSFSMGLPDLEKVEEKFWRTCPSRQQAKDKADVAVKSIFATAGAVVPAAAIDLTGMQKWEIVRHLNIVQSRKHQARRELPGRYTTSYKKAPEIAAADPCPETVKYGGRHFQFFLNYNGNSDQPGNFYFREINPLTGTSKGAIVYSFVPVNVTLNAPDVELLLLGEISRRKAHDQIKNSDDAMKDLPVGLGLAMAGRLITDGHLPLSDFWKKGKPYHIYTGDHATRKAGIANLHHAYSLRYMQNVLPEDRMSHLHKLMRDYFGANREEEDLTDAFARLFN